MIDEMGIFRTTAVGIAHVALPDQRFYLDDLLIDTGSEYNRIPGTVLDALGIQPLRTDRFETADGRVLERAVGFALNSALVALLGVGACTPQPALQTSAPSSLTITDPTKHVAAAQRGMVASASTFATAVGARVLAEGGNAVDAAAATAFTLAVTEPSMSGLGGRTSILIRTPSGEYYGIDGLNQVPSSFREGAPPGYANAAIPGVPAALAHAVEKYGSWPLSRIMAPAIRLAEEGFPLTPLEASRFADAAEELRSINGARRYFMKADGSAYRAGEIFIQKDLARTLRGIAEGGARAFYRGWIADSIHAAMVRGGGFITRDELARYQALPAILVRGTYRGHHLVSNYDPASGHVVIEALHIMEHFDLQRMPGAAEYASVVGQSMQLALTDRSTRMGTPEETARELTSQAHAAELSKQVVLPGPGARVPAGAVNNAPPPWWLRPDQDNTTHFSVVDSSRMAVAITQSLGPVLGTRLVASGLGFLYATRLGTVPGSRPGSTIAPTIVTDPSERLEYVLGGAGDSRIISAVIQTLSRAIDQQLPLELAVAAPRVHPMGGTTLRIERDSVTRIGWSDAEMARLKALGFTVETAPSTYYGRVHAIVIDQETRQLIGVAEVRGFGGAAGPVR